MKVCLINNIYPPYDRGGAEQVVQKTAEGLAAFGHEVIILTASPKGNEMEKKDRITIYRTRPLNLYFYTNAHRHSLFVRFTWHVFDMFNVSSALWVRNIIKKEKPDVIHTHNFMGLGFLIPRFLRSVPAVHVHTVHDTQLVEPSAIIVKHEALSPVRRLARSAYASLMRTLIGSPDIIISPSQFLLGFYESHGFFQKSKKVVVRNPLTFTIAPSGPSRTGERPLRFLYVGQIEEHKGVRLLISAFQHFLRAGKKSELHIVGSGSLLSEIETTVKYIPEITIYGRVSRESLREIFSDMDVLVVPSLCYENSPTVIFESMASGVPILASNIEGVAELIHSGENGLTFTAGDADDLARSLSWCVAHQDELQLMRERIPAFLHSLFRKEYIPELLTLYKRGTHAEPSRTNAELSRVDT